MPGQPRNPLKEKIVGDFLQWVSEFATSVRNEAQRAAKRKALKCWGSFLTQTYGIAMFSGSERILSQTLPRGNEKTFETEVLVAVPAT
jgi:hypothetical protein